MCDGDGNDVLSFCKSQKSEECVYILAESWSSVKSETLHKAWRKLFGKTVEVSEQTSGTQLLEIINNIQGELKVTEWMKSDIDDMASRILIYQEIVDSIQEADDSGEEKDMEGNDELTPCHS